jgi:hypothetical protein
MLARARRCLVGHPIASSSLLGYCQRLKLLQSRNTDRAVSADLDDTTGRQHLQDQVPIVGNVHELVHGWLADDGIEREADLRDVKDDALCAVVLKRPERHREGEATTRNYGAQAHI